MFLELFSGERGRKQISTDDNEKVEEGREDIGWNFSSLCLKFGDVTVNSGAGRSTGESLIPGPGLVQQQRQKHHSQKNDGLMVLVIHEHVRCLW